MIIFQANNIYSVNLCQWMRLKRSWYVILSYLLVLFNILILTTFFLVVTLFFINEVKEYLEVSLGPKGHYYVYLESVGHKPALNKDPPLDYAASIDRTHDDDEVGHCLKYFKTPMLWLIQLYGGTIDLSYALHCLDSIY